MQWKPLLVRLEVLEQLIPDVTVGKDKNQLPVRDVMDLLSAAAKNANGAVRAAAVRGIALVVQQVVGILSHSTFVPGWMHTNCLVGCVSPGSVML